MSILFRGMVEGERRRQRRQLWFALAVFWISLSAFAGLNYWLWTRFEARWERLQPGMTADQIRQSIGEPLYVQTHPLVDDDMLEALGTFFLGVRETWFYSSRPDADDQAPLRRLELHRGRLLGKLWTEHAAEQ